ncbi:MAG TPA: hypothetical protein VFC79_04395 [Tissierellaceae bacterium]|nr:hypothetical protein [Tissierellaceae bacterium]
MKEVFRKYLIKNGYKEWTPSGNPSTVYDYINRIDKICEWENISWEQLANDVQVYLEQYEPDGIKADLGRTSHSAVVNALRRFSESIVQKNN